MRKIILTTFLTLSAIYLNAQWKQTNGPFGGYVNDFVAKDSHIFAGTYGGVFRSTNNGGDWQEVNKGLTNLSINTLAVSGENIFAGTNEGIFFSTDNGSNWSPINNGFGYQDVSDIAISGDNIFVAAGSPVFKLVQNGSTWDRVYFGMPKNGQKIQSIAINGTHICALLIFQGAYVSPINTASWTMVTNSDQMTPLSAVAAFGNNMYMGTQKGLLISTNNGSSWAQYGKGFKTSKINAITKKGTDFLLGTDDGVFISKDSGDSWNALNSGISDPKIVALAFQGTHIYAAGAGVFHTSNYGINWNAANKGLISTLVLSIASVDSNIFAGTNFGVFLSADNGNNWNAVNTGLTNNVILKLAGDGTNIFAGTEGGLFLSTNNGNSWKLLNSGIPAQSITTLSVKGSNIFAGSYDGMYRSTNTGSSFTSVPYLQSKYITAVLVMGTTIYAGDDRANSYISKDNGVKWTTLDSGLINSITSFANIDTTIFAGSWASLYKSSPNARCWQMQLSGLPSLSVTDLVVSGTNIFAGIDGGGVYLSTLNTNNWIKADNGLINKIVRGLHVNGTNIYAGTFGNGVWILPLKEISQATSINKISTGNSRALIIYPNPTKGKFTIVNNSNVINSVIVHDLQGKVVFCDHDFDTRSLNDIDLSHISKGIYFITVYAYDKVFNEKIVLE